MHVVYFRMLWRVHIFFRPQLFHSRLISADLFTAFRVFHRCCDDESCGSFVTLWAPDKQKIEDSISVLCCIVYVRLRKQNNWSVRHLFVVAAMRHTQRILTHVLKWIIRKLKTRTAASDDGFIRYSFLYACNLRRGWTCGRQRGV